jgi:hypothetical protein
LAHGFRRLKGEGNAVKPLANLRDGRRVALAESEAGSRCDCTLDKELRSFASREGIRRHVRGIGQRERRHTIDCFTRDA